MHVFLYLGKYRFKYEFQIEKVHNVILMQNLVSLGSPYSAFQRRDSHVEPLHIGRFTHALGAFRFQKTI